MNKIILSLIIGTLINGCSSINQEYIQNKNIKTSETQENFYHAMVGSLMEYNSQNNNAINHFESILKKGYNKDITNKLLELYSEKEDYVAIFEILKKTSEENIIKNHKSYELDYYLINKQNKKAVKHTIKTLNDNENNVYNFYIQNRINKYYSITKSLKNIDILQQGNTEYFLKELSKTDVSIYETLKINYYKPHLINEYNYNNDKLNKHDQSIFLIFDFYGNPDIKLLKKIEKNGFNFSYMDELIFKYYEFLIKEKKYNEMIDVAKFLNSQEKSGNVNNHFFEYLSYVILFDNKNALYKLNMIKDSIEIDSYYYGKSILNYRLGYKNAAKKYMNKVENTKLIMENPNLYYDLIGNFDIIKKEYSNIEIMNYELEYFIEKRELDKANGISKDIEKYIEKEKINNFQLNANIIFLNYLNDENIGIKKAKKEFEKKNNKNTANLYSYILALSNTNIDKGIEIIEEYINEKTDTNIIDTYSWLLYKKGDYKKALNLYKENNMMHSQHYTIQYHIYKIYSKIGEKKKAKFHREASEQLFKK